MFERSLQDVVKGLRSQPTSEDRNVFASLVLQECRKEAASTDGAIKSQAIVKICHLRMLGYDKQNYGDDSTSFHIIETMALTNFKFKRMGYLAAEQLLTSQSAVLLLATNSLKKELSSSEVYVVGQALGATSNFLSLDLSRDLLEDVILVTSSSIKPYARKRGTLCLYKLCMKFPEALNLGAYDALRARLDDSDSSVVSCAVNAICELAKVNPRNVLPLTPQLYALLTLSGNNWLTIKVVKLYASLLQVEPRLGRKLLDPLVHIISTTQAKSLLFEAISTVTRALCVMSKNPADGVKRERICLLCAKKLREFVHDQDQNLKFLGLTGFIELTKAASSPLIASNNLDMKEIILCCLKDEDPTVRLKALELLSSMATKETVSGIVVRLLDYLPLTKNKHAIVRCIILACVGPNGGDDDDYRRIPSCEWFFAVLMDLARLGGGVHGKLIAQHLVSMVIRVPAVRGFASESARKLLMEDDLSAVSRQVLRACAFVCCEYQSSEEKEDSAFVSRLLRENDPVFILNAFKLLGPNCCRPATEAKASSYSARDRLAWNLQASSSTKVATACFGPVHPRAQSRVEKPAQLENQDPTPEKKVREGRTSFSISFRGVTEVPYTAPTSSFAAAFKPPPTTEVQSRYSRPPPAQHDIRPFMLSRNNAEEDEENDTLPPPIQKKVLWSASAAATTAVRSDPIVVLPAPGFGENEDFSKSEAKKKKKKKDEAVSLADVELVSNPEHEMNTNASPVVEEEKKKKKKKKKAPAVEAVEEDLIQF